MSLDLSPEEEEAIKELARRQHESSAGEARLLQKYASRAALAKQLWVAIFSVGSAIVFGTMFVLNMQRAVEQNRADIAANRGELVANRAELIRHSELITDLRLQMKDKADRTR